jgi:hypothetical protein
MNSKPTKKQANGRQRAPQGNRPQKQQMTQQRPQRNQIPRIQKTQNLGANSTSVASAYSSQVKTNNPRISYGLNGKSCRVTHKEFIQNVTGTSAFTIPIFLPLNPGLSGTFPWLAAIANNFEQYRVHKMRFCYLTRTGTNVPGSVLIAPDYDASDVAPVSEQILSNYAEIVEDAPWKDICCSLRPAGMHALGPKKFVRNGLVPGQDLKTTDVGSIILATVDGTATNWGKLWVEYDVEFFEPQLNPQGSGLSSTAQGTAGTAAAIISAGLSIQGSLIASVVANTLTLQNLVPGGEYFAIGVAATSAQTITSAIVAGANLKTTMFTVGAENGITFIATAPFATITFTSSGNIVNPYLVIAPVTIGTL